MVEPGELLAPAVEVVLGVEEEVVQDREGPAGGVVRQALDLEPGPGPQAVAGEVDVVLHLVGQQPAVGRPERELPGIEGRLDREVGVRTITRPSADSTVHGPRSGWPTT